MPRCPRSRASRIGRTSWRRLNSRRRPIRSSTTMRSWLRCGPVSRAPSRSKANRRRRHRLCQVWHRRGLATLGPTPLKNVRLPLGLLRLKAEKPGFDTAQDVTFLGAGGTATRRSDSPPRERHRKEWCARLPARQLRSVRVYLSNCHEFRFDGFWVECHEVTNRQYKAFLDAVATSVASLAASVRPRRQDALVRRGPWHVPRCHRQAGPATWTLGNYPSGEEGLPVTGVS